MTEDDARAWLRARSVPRETFAALDRFVAFLMRETASQNLIAASTRESVWSRHVVDSAQLLLLAPRFTRWLDIGSGAGFPGLIVALLGAGRVTLVEPRAKRVAFLREAVRITDLADRVEIVAARIETLDARPFDVISARAVAPLPRLLDAAFPFAARSTRWLLPKGRSAAQELEAARASWQGAFELVPSITDSAASIIVASGVTPRKRR